MTIRHTQPQEADMLSDLALRSKGTEVKEIPSGSIAGRMLPMLELAL